MHEGWHYFLVLSGSPLLQLGGQTVRTRPGDICLSDPDAVVGHRDRPGQRCQMLTWIWRTPPSHSAVKPAPGESLRISLNRAQVRRLKQLHLECREAVAGSNERSMLQLRVSRLQLDLCLLGATEHPSAVDGGVRLELAIDFMRNHLGERLSIRKLCEYLQVSETSLKRLFHEHTGKSPREFAKQWKMDLARDQLLPSGQSVKAVAYALGYRHAADFSRAFKRHFGVVASTAVSPAAFAAARKAEAAQLRSA